MISVVSAVRDLGRLREITSVLVKHGFGEVVTRIGFGRKPRRGTASDPPPPLLEEATGDAEPGVEITTDDLAKGEEAKKRISTGERIRLVLQDLGPTFIKLGQIASTRPDVIPAEVIAELRKLQDDVPAVPFADVKSVIETSLGAPLDKIFVTFEEAPLATASIGQVHRATLLVPGPDGDREEDVVVKVQRPNVGATVARDLELLHILAAALERAIPETKIYSPIGLVQQFDRSITAELNYTIEGENGERFTKNFEGSSQADKAKFPKTHKHASSKQVLTLEFFDGIKIDKAVPMGLDGPLIAKRSFGVIIKQIFDDGFFHADPHPGNVMVMGTKEEPVIGLIDLGMVGRLSPELRDRTVDLMLAAVRKDGYAVADALYAISRPTKKIDMRDYREYVAQIAEKYLGKPLKEIEISAMIRDLVQGAMKYELEIPTDFLLVGKALMTIEGIGKQLDPDLDVFGEAQPYFTAILKKRYSPQRLGNELIRGVEQLSRAGYDVPLQAREVLEDLRLGRLVLNTSDPQLPVVTDRLGRRVFSGLVVASATLAGAMAMQKDMRVAIVLFSVAGAILVIHYLRDRGRGKASK